MMYLLPESRDQGHLVLVLSLVEALSRKVHNRFNSKRLPMVLIESTTSEKQHHWHSAVANRKPFSQLSVLLPKG